MMVRLWLAFLALLIFAGGCEGPALPARPPAVENRNEKLASLALEQIGVTTRYDPAYVPLKYPGGDLPPDRGVCTDVVVRALRRQGVDLQKLVHEDMKRHFSAYPQKWGLKRPDPNIDHRRVENLQRLFVRKGKALPVSGRGEDYKAGEIVTWRLRSGRAHIGIVSGKRLPGGRPLVIHNIGSGVRLEDVLFSAEITGRFRYWPD